MNQAPNHDPPDDQSLDPKDSTNLTAMELPPTHIPLDHSLHQIRLLSFANDPTNGKLCFDLSVVDLDNCPPFIALSYVWGAQNTKHEIDLNGQPFLVVEKLHSALTSISSYVREAKNDDECSLLPNTTRSAAISEDNPQGWTHFWIDAISIDQSTTHERTHQVRMMSQIYTTAAFVLVWFGPECQSALEAIAITENPKLRTVYWPYSDKLQRSALTMSLLPFLNSAYWTRMWTLQEFVLAQRILFAAGPMFVQWHRVQAIFPDVYATIESHVMPTLEQYTFDDGGHTGYALTLVNERRQHFFRRTQKMLPSLHELILRFGLLECSDRRDKVFALAGLLDDGGHVANTVLIVDYSLDTAQLAIQVLRLASQTLVLGAVLDQFYRWLVTALDIDVDIGGPVGKELDKIRQGTLSDIRHGEWRDTPLSNDDLSDYNDSDVLEVEELSEMSD